MELNKFSIKHVALGTKDLGQLANHFVSKFDYIETSISYCNDFILGKYLGKNTKIISEISSIAEQDIMLKYHLKWLNRKKIDILLFNPNGAWNEDQLRDLYGRKGIFYNEFGLSNIDSVEDINKIMDLGIKPDWVSLTLNPTYFNLPLIEFLKENNIKIISHGILGGDIMAKTNIEVYSLQYLLSFAALYSDIVCISSHSMEEAMENKMILEKCIDQEITDDIKGLLVFPSSRIVKRGPITPLPLHRYLSINNLLIKFKGKKNYFVPMITMEDDIEYIPERDISELTDIEKKVEEALENIVLPSDCIPGSNEAEAYWWYSIVAYLHTLSGNFKYKYTYEKMGNIYMIARVNKYRFKKKAEVFLLAISDSQTTPIFRQMKNDPFMEG